MKNSIITLLFIMTIFNTYLSLRNAVWSEKVANNYMVGLYQQQKCYKYVILENRIPILERILGLSWAPPAGVLDTTECDKARDQWILFEKSNEQYRKLFAWPK